MSWAPDGRDAAVIRAGEAEVIADETISLRLLLDASATGDALSALRVDLRSGRDGASPHRHTRSSELFYVLDGSVDLLAGQRVLTATAGDLVVVPPGLPHAFAATVEHDGQLLIVITPGVERFDYFRRLARIATGQLSADTLLPLQDRYDTHFLTSAAWQQART